MTRNLAVDLLRRRTRETALGDGRELRAVDTGSELALRTEVLDAVRDLPEQQRRAVAMRYLLDLSQADVAAALGVRPGTVATHVSRALAALREALRDAAPRPYPTPPQEPTVQITSTEQATGLVGTDRTVHARVTGRVAGGAGFTADIGVPALYHCRLHPVRWAGSTPDSIVGAEFDCVVIDIDAERRPVITDPLAGEDADRFDRWQRRIRDLRPGERFTGRVSAVVPFGAFVEFDGVRGLLHVSEFDAAAPPLEGQDLAVEIADTYVPLARVSLRIAR